MTHPKARTTPRRRERRDPQDRIVITEKGRALLTTLEQLRAIHIDRNLKFDPHHYEISRATPCAPNRGNDAPAPLPANNAGTAGAPPAHPAGKSDAAPLVNQPETDQ